MNYILLSIKDELIGAFMPPAPVKHIEEAKRGLQNLLENNDPKNPLCKNTKDYSLWTIGEFNDETGEVINKTNEQICPLVALKPKGANNA